MYNSSSLRNFDMKHEHDDIQHLLELQQLRLIVCRLVYRAILHSSLLFDCMARQFNLARFHIVSLKIRYLH